MDYELEKRVKQLENWLEIETDVNDGKVLEELAVLRVRVDTLATETKVDTLIRQLHDIGISFPLRSYDEKKEGENKRSLTSEHTNKKEEEEEWDEKEKENIEEKKKYILMTLPSILNQLQSLENLSIPSTLQSQEILDQSDIINKQKNYIELLIKNYNLLSIRTTKALEEYVKLIINENNEWGNLEKRLEIIERRINEVEEEAY